MTGFDDFESRPDARPAALDGDLLDHDYTHNDNDAGVHVDTAAEVGGESYLD